MPRTSKQTAAQGADHGPVVDRSEALDGYTVKLASFLKDVDATPLLKGLHDDKCQCPHWGYVIKGSLTYRFDDRDEVFEAGDAFYLPPGHIPVHNEPGSEIVQFSPTAELRQVEAVITENLKSMLAG
jgi:Cupin domain